MIYHKDWILPSIESCQNVVQAYIDDPAHGLTAYENQYIVGHESDSETYLTYSDLANYTADPGYIYFGFIYHALPPQSTYLFEIEDYALNTCTIIPDTLGKYPIPMPLMFNKITGSLGNNEFQFIGYKFKLYVK